MKRRVDNFLVKQKDKLVDRATSYAIDKFGSSEYARKTFSIIPVTIIATFIKACFNFLITSRLITGYRILDSVISLVVACFTALLSPIFYVMVRENERAIISFSDHFVNRVFNLPVRINNKYNNTPAPSIGPVSASHSMGIEYLIEWRNRIILLISGICIIFLLIVEVNSYYLIWMIIEFLVGFWVIDKVNLFRESLFKIHFNAITTTVDNNMKSAKRKIIDANNEIALVIKNGERRIVFANTDKPKVAKHISLLLSISTNSNNTETNGKSSVILRNTQIIEDWNGNHKT